MDVNWNSYQYEADGVHITAGSFESFCDDVAGMLRPHHGRWLVLTDSTVGWHDYGDRGEWTGWASGCLEAKLGRGSIVDAINGSGFTTPFTHFRGRLRARRTERYDHVLFMGGWNDEHAPLRVLEQAALGCVKVAGHLWAHHVLANIK